jgi:hypothetical protein
MVTTTVVLAACAQYGGSLVRSKNAAIVALSTNRPTTVFLAGLHSPRLLGPILMPRRRIPPEISGAMERAMLLFGSFQFSVDRPQQRSVITGARQYPLRCCQHFWAVDPRRDRHFRRGRDSRQQLIDFRTSQAFTLFVSAALQFFERIMRIEYGSDRAKGVGDGR